MKINYSVTGSDRKALAEAISQELNTPAKYLAAPTFAYQVGGYRIDRNGTLEGADNLGLVADLQGLHSFTAVSTEYDTPIPEPIPLPEEIRIPYEAALGGKDSPYRDFEEPPAYGIPDTAGADETDRLTIEMPLDGFTDTALENLGRLIASKAALIRKAIGADALPVERMETTLRFPWFSTNTTGDEVAAFTRFVSALCTTAKERKRVTAKEKPVVSEKLTFRVFLIQLGFVGREYKAARKILLKNLSGSSAFSR